MTSVIYLYVENVRSLQCPIRSRPGLFHCGQKFLITSKIEPEGKRRRKNKRRESLTVSDRPGVYGIPDGGLWETPKGRRERWHF